jgi:hypothetical protein
VTLADIDKGNTAPLLNSTILALDAGKNLKNPPALPYEEKSLKKDFIQAGIAIRSTPSYYLILGASNGGVLKIFNKSSEKQIIEDCGILGESVLGDKFTTQSTNLNNPLRSGENSLECETSFYRLKDILPNPINYLVLRLYNLTFMRIEFINEAIKKLIVRMLVKNRSRLSLKRTRTIRLQPQNIEISDVICNAGDTQLKSLVQGEKFTTIHMASARYFTPAQFNSSKAQVLDHMALNRDGIVQSTRKISFAGLAQGKAK